MSWKIDSAITTRLLKGYFCNIINFATFIWVVFHLIKLFHIVVLYNMLNIAWRTKQFCRQTTIFNVLLSFRYPYIFLLAADIWHYSTGAQGRWRLSTDIDYRNSSSSEGYLVQQCGMAQWRSHCNNKVAKGSHNFRFKLTHNVSDSEIKDKWRTLS